MGFWAKDVFSPTGRNTSPAIVPTPAMSLANSTVKLDYAQLSDVGMRRANNQDSLTTVVAPDAEIWRQRGHLLMVADGMGAHAAGELASKLAVDNVPHTYYKLSQMASPGALRQAVRQANEVIHDKGQNSIDFQGMGTTCTCLVLVPQGALVAHVGDSRAYRLRNNCLEQLSFDHSLVWETAAASQLPEESLSTVIPKNVITRSLGPHEAVNVDLEGPFDVQQGDVFLVCSDGLSGQVTDEEIGTIIGCVSPQHAAQTLIDLANLRGGPDNISVIVARVEDAPASTVSATKQATSAGKPAAHPLSPWAWLMMFAWVALLAVSGWNRWIWGVLIGLAGFGTTVAISFLQRLHPSSNEPVTELAGPYGNGPYRTFDCTPGRGVVDALAEIAGQLRELPQQEGWAVDMDWSAIDAHQKQALQAVDRADWRTAISEFCHIIRITMQQLRERRATVTTQTGIRLD